MFRFVEKFAFGPNPKVIHSLRISINSLDMHLAVRDIDPDIAVSRAAIFSGAALIRDLSITFRRTDRLRELLRGDINHVYSSVAEAHRTAVVGMATILIGSSPLHCSRPMDLIFAVEPKTEGDATTALAVAFAKDKGVDVQQLGLSTQIATRFGLNLSSSQLQEGTRLLNKRLADAMTLSKANANRPFLDFLRSEIL